MVRARISNMEHAGIAIWMTQCIDQKSPFLEPQLWGNMKYRLTNKKKFFVQINGFLWIDMVLFRHRTPASAKVCSSLSRVQLHIFHWFALFSIYKWQSCILLRWVAIGGGLRAVPFWVVDPKWVRELSNSARSSPGLSLNAFFTPDRNIGQV